MKPFVIASFILLAACARPLTDNENAFAGALFGDSLDRDAVTIRVGIGLTPLPRPKPAEGAAANAGEIPAGFCTRTPHPRQGLSWPAAFVLWDDVFFNRKFYAPDTFAGWPHTVPVPHSLIMSHELVHVWQWQNRDRTDYRPSASAAESGEGIDPYYWHDSEKQEFLSYGFEQQAAMIEDYICYRLFEKENPRLDELYNIINPALPLAGLEALLAQTN